VDTGVYSELRKKFDYHTAQAEMKNELRSGWWGLYQDLDEIDELEQES
jgi:hypothetical protein